MIEVLVLIFMFSATVRASSRLRKQTDLFTEFHAPTTAIYLSWLYPVAPLLLYGLLFLTHPLIAAAVALFCYLPALFALSPVRNIFERSGTSRTRPVQDELALLTFVGAGGVAYVLVSIAVRMLISVSAPIG